MKNNMELKDLKLFVRMRNKNVGGRENLTLVTPNGLFQSIGGSFSKADCVGLAMLFAKTGLTPKRKAAVLTNDLAKVVGRLRKANKNIGIELTDNGDVVLAADNFREEISAVDDNSPYPNAAYFDTSIYESWGTIQNFGSVLKAREFIQDVSCSGYSYRHGLGLQCVLLRGDHIFSANNVVAYRAPLSGTRKDLPDIFLNGETLKFFSPALKNERINISLSDRFILLSEPESNVRVALPTVDASFPNMNFMDPDYNNVCVMPTEMFRNGIVELLFEDMCYPDSVALITPAKIRTKNKIHKWPQEVHTQLRGICVDLALLEKVFDSIDTDTISFQSGYDNQPLKFTAIGKKEDFMVMPIKRSSIDFS